MNSSTDQNKYQRILNYLQTIRKSPKKEVKFFYFDKDEDKFIVDGNRLKLLPLEYSKLYAKDEFYVHVNVREKEVMYYAYDLEYTSEENIREEEGVMSWDKNVEDCIYNFFILNIKDLTDTLYPHSDAVAPTTSSYTRNMSDMDKPKSESFGGFGSGSAYSNYQHNYGNVYNSNGWKEREEFYDKIWALQKQNRTSKAVDHISQHITKMCVDKKFDDLDSLLRSITFDKLSITSMLMLLDATRGADRILRERKIFYDKVKTHITKLKPSRVEMVLGKLEPGKEYENVIWYQKEDKKEDKHANK